MKDIQYFIETSDYKVIVLLNQITYFEVNTGKRKNDHTTIWAHLVGGGKISLGNFRDESFALVVMKKLKHFLNGHHNIMIGNEDYGNKDEHYATELNHFLVPTESLHYACTEEEYDGDQDETKMNREKSIDGIFDAYTVDQLKKALDFMEIQVSSSEKNKLNKINPKEEDDYWIKEAVDKSNLSPNDQEAFIAFEKEALQMGRTNMLKNLKNGKVDSLENFREKEAENLSRADEFKQAMQSTRGENYNQKVVEVDPFLEQHNMHQR